MLKTFRERIKKQVSQKSLIVSIAVFVLAAFFIYSPYTGIGKLNAISETFSPYDMSSFYTLEEAYENEALKNSELKDAYTVFLFIDLFYAFAYTQCLCFLLTFMYKKKGNLSESLILLPLAAGLFDIFENAIFLLTLHALPLKTNLILAASYFFTPIKFVLIASTFALLVFSLVKRKH